MSDLETVVRAYSSRTGRQPHPGASPEELAAFAQAFEQEFSWPLPEALAGFLAVTNGLAGSSLIVWPTRAYGPFEEGLIDANRSWRLSPDSPILLAQIDDTLYAWDPADGSYPLLDWRTHEALDYYDSCEGLLRALLARALELAHRAA